MRHFPDRIDLEEWMELMKTVLSDEFLTSSGAVVVGSEPAWRRDQLPAVLSEYARGGYAVEAFEIWWIDESGRVTCVYDVNERSSEESRDAFVARCREEIWRTIGEWNLEKAVAEEVRSGLRYTLYVAEEYEQAGLAE